VGKLEVSPAQIRLEGQRATQQIVVTGYIHGEPRDLTDKAQFEVAKQGVIRIQKGRVQALQNGSGEIVVRVGDRSLRLPFVVTQYKIATPISFELETLAILTKQGCSSGSCHGSPHGKGGFSLSLFGYDSRMDRVALTRDGFNRRINGIEPQESLLLKKPLLAVPHVGGKRLRKEEIGYRILKRWIAEGASTQLSSLRCQSIALTPSTSRVLEGEFKTQQIRVSASFSDGKVQDITSIATYTSSHPAVAEVTPDGKIVAKGRGQAAISVRYLDKFESLYVTVIEPVKGFIWKPVAENSRIDLLVNQKLRQLQYLPANTCSDSEFLRRVSLDLTGVLPTAEESRQFLKETSPRKRLQKIDALLDSEEYARFWAQKKADLMRVSPRLLTEERANRFSTWLIDSVRKNTPYDQFTRTLLTAQGLEAQAPPANYFLGIRSAEERTEMTAQIFMGTRVECAKCHNHPFENWTMRDYYRIAAVFARTKADNGKVQLASTGEVLHPTTGEKMVPWGVTAPSSDTSDRREIFTQWLTQPTNPLFARVEVNRIWADLLGRGIVEPIDDFRSSNPPSNAPLLDYLAQEFIRSGYDRKSIIRLICNSQTYQRSSQSNPFNAQDTALFSHAKPRLLTAEQLKDAIGTTTHSLTAPTLIPKQIAEVQTELTTHFEALDREFPNWLARAEVFATQLPLRQGVWQMRPPRKISDPATVLKEYTSTALPSLDSSNDWIRRPDYTEQGQNPLPMAEAEDGYNLTIMARHLFSDKPRTVTLRWSAEWSRLWLNGAPLHANPQQGEHQVALPLHAGENTLHLLVATTPERAHFSSHLKEPFTQVTMEENRARRLSPAVLEALVVSASKRGQERRLFLQDFYRESDAKTVALRQKIDSLTTRANYATQRLYPELSSFTTTFGQPPRSTACTCERKNSPTLLQALELLNGQTAYQNTQTGADYYAPKENSMLLEELYLTALCRYPSQKERTIALKHLTNARQKREQAVMDLLWTVINTQEFLFQH
jgi:hypothetical protein